MPITEAQYDKISDEIHAHDFFYLGDLARRASSSNIFRELYNLHSLAKRALEYRYDDSTHASLIEFHEELEEVRCGVTNAMEALEKIDKVLSKVENILLKELYADEFQDE